MQNSCENIPDRLHFSITVAIDRFKGLLNQPEVLFVI